MAIDNEEEVIKESPQLGIIDEVTMHPLVLLSVADHYHRVARGTRKRVVGVLLGSVHKGKVDCTNSFAVPFEEDSRNPVSNYTTYCKQQCKESSMTYTQKEFFPAIQCLSRKWSELVSNRSTLCLLDSSSVNIEIGIECALNIRCTIHLF